MVTELWLDPSIKSNEIFQKYNQCDITRRDRAGDSHGRVIIITRIELKLHNINISKELDVISETIKLEDKKKVMLAAYYSILRTT